MKALDPSHLDRNPEYQNEIREYINSNSFEIFERYKNILTVASGGVIFRNIQEANNAIYGSRKTPFEVITALEYLHSLAQGNSLKLKELEKEFGADKENTHPKILALQETTHEQATTVATPDISQEFVDEVNKTN